MPLPAHAPADAARASDTGRRRHESASLSAAAPGPGRALAVPRRVGVLLSHRHFSALASIADAPILVPAGGTSSLGVTTQAASGSTSSSSAGGVSNTALLADFSAALASLLPASTAGLRRARGGAASGPASAGHNTPLGLILQPDAIIAAVHEDPSFGAALMRHLPDGQQTLEQLIEVVSGRGCRCTRATELQARAHLPLPCPLPARQIRSPQLHQAMSSVSGAMDSANAASVFANFGLRPADGSEALVRGDGSAALVHAVQARADRERAAAATGAASVAAASAGGPPAAPSESSDGAAPPAPQK